MVGAAKPSFQWVTATSVGAASDRLPRCQEVAIACWLWECPQVDGTLGGIIKIKFLWLFGNASDGRLLEVFVIIYPTGKVLFCPGPAVPIVPPVVIPLAAFSLCKLPGHIRGRSRRVMAQCKAPAVFKDSAF